MKLEFDKEMDALLREGARRGRAAPAARVERDAEASVREEHSGLPSISSGAHLDADEQNAYAENALPPSARTHYAAHLADCDDCRRSVTQLALAAGTPAQLEQQAATAAATATQGSSRHVSWRERIGALLAPRAWRYAVPALALLLVGAVTLTVLMRSRQSEELVAAQRNNKSQPAKPAITETHHAPQEGNNNAPTIGEGSAPSASNSNAPLPQDGLAAGVPKTQGQPTAGVVIDGAAAAPPPPVTTSADTAGAPAAAAPPVAAAAANMATPMPTSMPVPEEVIVTQEAERKAKVAERADESAKDVQKLGNYENNQSRERISGPRRNEQSRNIQRGNVSLRDGADKNDVALATPTPAPAAPTASARRARQREADAERDNRSADDAKKSEGAPAPKPVAAETRTVAGRKFRRAGGAWIDTAYQSSQSVTVIRRNSEQYRALIADEPELRRISDALGGEVTVVWKGRAYRIR